ncbi:histone acetyltransferase NGG1 [Spizellomyces punctatus DAOM BR117]|uniref:Histone acetyltransferases subunit 3 n=1 Tax=Spizellomyces punctatus (strain DAOM BR117) TaxID=645134 RepID=A0A0L0HKT3_SPIPD|nr:histone acetyltransferase NGG1 [Spizellomyces punctatus DAOM BR117]KND01712.1 hypothetical protein SPPG_03506 [Spizellomyces punctatus DAOM BR117]|eukprot:XP_016609751.1 hypothetical protein SPPG_03506 [Spizellomyces punctatus DAOM BR117]
MSSKPKAPPLDYNKLPELSLDAAPTLKRYLDYLTNAINLKSSGAPPAEIFQPFTPSQLPALPSSVELQRLKQELEGFDQATKSRQDHVARNMQALERWVPAKSLSNEADKGKEGIRIKDGKAMEKRKELSKEKKIKLSGDESSRDEARVTLKLKIAPQSGARNEKSDDGITPLDSPISVSADTNKKRKREMDHDDVSDTDRDKRSSTSSNSTLKAGAVRVGLGIEQTPIAPGKPPNHRSVVPKAKPRTSKKSGAQKNNKLKKRSSMVDSEDLGRQTPEIDDRMDGVTDIPVEGDYTKAKPIQNQIPIQTFWGFVDQFYRPLTEEDLKYLDAQGDEVTPYIVPGLGRPYKEQWADEEAKFMSQLDAELSAASYSAPLGQEYNEINGAVHCGDVYFKPLSERIIASLLENRITSYIPPNSPMGACDYDKISFRTNGDMMDLEQRMRNELRFIGLIDDDEEGAGNDEEDEISKDLRRLQAQLREQAAINRSRKQQLKEVAQKWMAWQEYNGVLEDINKNIEQAYTKRFRTPAKSKGKKKILKGEYRPMTEDVMHYLANRQKIIDEVGAFFPPEQYKIPETSIYSR